MNNCCGNCGSSTIELITEQEDFFFKGHYFKVDVDYSLCAMCGAEFISTEQIKINDERIKEITQ